MPGVWEGIGAVGDELLPAGVPEVREHEGQQVAFNRRLPVARGGRKRSRPVVIRLLWCPLRLPPAWLTRMPVTPVVGRTTLSVRPYVGVSDGRKVEKLTLILASAYTEIRPQAATFAYMPGATRAARPLPPGPLVDRSAFAASLLVCIKEFQP